MNPQECWQCGNFAEPPFSVVFLSLPEEVIEWAEEQGLPTEKEVAMCLDCLEAIRADQEMALEIEAKERTGSICAMCAKELDPPGGTTIQSRDKQRIYRVCFSCRESMVKARGW